MALPVVTWQHAGESDRDATPAQYQRLRQMNTESPAVAALDPAALQLIVRTLGLSPADDSSEGDTAAGDTPEATSADANGASAGAEDAAEQRSAEGLPTAGMKAGAAAVRKAEAAEAARTARAAPRNRQLLVDWAESGGTVKLPVCTCCLAGSMIPRLSQCLTKSGPGKSQAGPLVVLSWIGSRGAAQDPTAGLIRVEDSSPAQASLWSTQARRQGPLRSRASLQMRTAEGEPATWHVTATINGADERALLQQARAHLKGRVVLRLHHSDQFQTAARNPSYARCAQVLVATW